MGNDSFRLGRLVGWARLAVGIGMIVAPRQSMEVGGGPAPTGESVLLARTIGVRDLVLGLGTVRAVRARRAADTQRWLAMGLCSDAIDVVVGSVSEPLVGRRGSLIAALLPVPFVAGDIAALAALRRGPADDGD